MQTDILRLMEAQGGAASVTQLRSAGISRHAIDTTVRAGDITRLRRDVLVLASALKDATPWQRQALIARAVGLSLAPAARPGLALSHGSLLRLHDLPCFGDDDLVHLSRVGTGKSRRDGIVWVHNPVPPELTEEVEGIRAVVPALAALQVAATHGLEAGVVALDGVLHQAEVEDARLAHAQGRAPDPFGWRSRDPADVPGPARTQIDQHIEVLLERGFGNATSSVRKVVAIADGRSESAGESRSRWVLHLLGLGRVTPQFAVWDGSVLVGVADLKLDEHMVLVEFDGRGKYADQDDLFREKWREDRLRELGYEVVRLTWADLARPQVVRERILAAIARSRNTRSRSVG